MTMDERDINDLFDSQLSSNVPQVTVEGGFDEDRQLSEFANATLIGSRDEKWAVSIATYIDIPKGLDAEEVRLMVQAALEMAAKASPILMFDAKVGPSFDYEVIVAEEERMEATDEEE